MEYFNLSPETPLAEKKLVVSGKKLSQELLTRIALDIRRNKPAKTKEGA
jgi:hypothetical protein